MAKRSKARTTFYATLLLALCMALPWLLSPSGCQLDTRPIIKPHPHVESDDSDSGEHER